MKHRILVVDDEASQRELVAGFLKKQGHEVFPAGGGFAIRYRSPHDTFFPTCFSSSGSSLRTAIPYSIFAIGSPVIFRFGRGATLYSPMM